MGWGRGGLKCSNDAARQSSDKRRESGREMGERFRWIANLGAGCEKNGCITSMPVQLELTD